MKRSPQRRPDKPARSVLYALLGSTAAVTLGGTTVGSENKRKVYCHNVTG